TSELVTPRSPRGTGSAAFASVSRQMRKRSSGEACSKYRGLRWRAAWRPPSAVSVVVDVGNFGDVAGVAEIERHRGFISRKADLAPQRVEAVQPTLQKDCKVRLRAR